MGKWGEEGIKATLALVRRLWNQIIPSVSAEIRKGQNWSSKNISPVLSIVTEKWLGFCYAFIVTLAIGFLGTMMVETARWGSSQPELAKSVPNLILFVGAIGFFGVLLWGMVLSVLFLVSGVRFFFWLRNMWKDYWNRDTPRYTDPVSERDTRHRPPSDEEEKKARANALKYAKRGTLLFLILTTVLLYGEMKFSDQIYPVIRSYDWSSVTEIVNATFFLIDLEGVAEIIGVSLDPVQIVGSLIAFGIPSVFLAISMRNLLLYSESFARKKIEKAAEGSKLEWRRIGLILQVIATSMYAGAALYLMVSG